MIKLGSQVITKVDGGIISEVFDEIAQDIKELTTQNIYPVIVSSGAINTARSEVNWKGNDITTLQALSSLGQPKLMQAYQNSFDKLSLKCAQILLTHEDFKHRTRYLNIRNTILKLLSEGIIPILNENDAVSFNEITLGDNDQLASFTAQMIEADLLLLITSVDGVMSHSPENSQAKTISLVEDITKLKVSTDSKTKNGKGGMSSKLAATKKATQVGIEVIISGKDYPHFIQRSLTQEVGTFFQAKNKQNSKKKWMLSAYNEKGKIIIDQGCCNALIKSNSSLLAAGIKSVKGDFKRGEVIGVYYNSKCIAVGLSEYNQEEIEKIKGKKTQEIMQIFPQLISKEVIHKDNLVLCSDES